MAQPNLSSLAGSKVGTALVEAAAAETTGVVGAELIERARSITAADVSEAKHLLAQLRSALGTRETEVDDPAALEPVRNLVAALKTAIDFAPLGQLGEQAVRFGVITEAERLELLDGHVSLTNEQVAARIQRIATAQSLAMSKAGGNGEALQDARNRAAVAGWLVDRIAVLRGEYDGGQAQDLVRLLLRPNRLMDLFRAHSVEGAKDGQAIALVAMAVFTFLDLVRRGVLGGEGGPSNFGLELASMTTYLLLAAPIMNPFFKLARAEADTAYAAMVKAD